MILARRHKLQLCNSLSRLYLFDFSFSGIVWIEKLRDLNNEFVSLSMGVMIKGKGHFSVFLAIVSKRKQVINKWNETKFVKKHKKKIKHKDKIAMVKGMNLFLPETLVIKKSCNIIGQETILVPPNQNRYSQVLLSVDQ